MTTLNLAHPNLGDIKVTLGMFPDGEPTVKIDSDLSDFQKDVVTIMTRITSPKELFVLQLTADILNRWGIKFNIYVSYLMSQRMDRVMAFIRPFSLKVVADTINSLGASNVLIEEPHSDASLHLIHNSIAMDHRVLAPTEDALIVFPDKGAWDRYPCFRDKAVVCSKKRNLETGEILGLEVSNEELLKGEDYQSIVIIDDLVDGGTTLLAVRNKIKELLTREVPINISVVHAVNAEGLMRLSPMFDNIYISNSYSDWVGISTLQHVHIKQII